MLAWFKKKFGKQQAPQSEEEIPSGAISAIDDEQSSAAEPIVQEKPPVAAQNELAAKKLPDKEQVLIEEPSTSQEEEEEIASSISQKTVLEEKSEELSEPALSAVSQNLVGKVEIKKEQLSSTFKEIKEPKVEVEKEVRETPDTHKAGEAHKADEVEAALPAFPVEEDAPGAAEPEEVIESTVGLPEEEHISVEELDSKETATTVASPVQQKPEAKSMFRRLQERLGRTRDSFVYQLDRLFMGEKEINQDLFDQLEEILITADLGVSTTMELLDFARKRVKRDKLSDPMTLKAILRERMLDYITASEQPADLVMPEEGPFVIMVVGVNGVGKTTTIGKIAAKFKQSGQSVLLVAGDTFRAAAIDQLKIWASRVGVDIVAQQTGADPASVVYDGIEYGIAQKADVIIIDTAGRLHTSVNLMGELKKIQRVIGKRLPGAPHEVLQVIDATTGQNGISQAKLFHETVGVSGLALTKLDGTAKGGIVANICRELKIPVRFIGIGEQIDDLRDFEAGEFVDALFTVSAK